MANTAPLRAAAASLLLRLLLRLEVRADDDQEARSMSFDKTHNGDVRMNDYFRVMISSTERVNFFRCIIHDTLDPIQPLNYVT